MRVLFIFLDGVGLGENDAGRNPFARASMPVLQDLLGGQRMLSASAPHVGKKATLLALNAGLGVGGLPQSATGQAVLLTGINVPAEVGEHYGPKPNEAVARVIRAGNLFHRLKDAGKDAVLLNAYPPRYFRGLISGKRLYSAIPLAVTSAGGRLFDKDDLYAGRALSADFTGEGWREMLGFPDAPLLSPAAAGLLLGDLAQLHDFSLFEYWSTDYAGHKQDMDWAVRQLEEFDQVLQGLLEPGRSLLTVITSDHGNMEDLGTRRHTLAHVPALLLGPEAARQEFSQGLIDLTGITPAIIRLVTGTD